MAALKRRRETPKTNANEVSRIVFSIRNQRSNHRLNGRFLSAATAQAGPERKKIEMLFAHLKRILRLDRLRLRGPFGAQDEFLLAATVQNLRKLAKLIRLPAPVPA
jgi:hypothetical protein